MDDATEYAAFEDRCWDALSGGGGRSAKEGHCIRHRAVPRARAQIGTRHPNCRMLSLLHISDEPGDEIISGMVMEPVDMPETTFSRGIWRPRAAFTIATTLCTLASRSTPKGVDNRI